MLVLTVLLVSLLMFVVYQLAAARIEPETKELQEQVAFLGQELAALSERYLRKQSRLRVVEREAEVFRRANRLLREEESRRQAELSRMQSELDFYSRLAGTSGSQTGLAVYAAEIIATDSERVFQFILTLTQNLRRASVISGRARIDVEGTLDNRPVTLNWSQLTDGSSPEPSFRFKYFQQLQGYLTLPENFKPTRLRVTLEVKDKRKPPSHAIDWDELITASSKEIELQTKNLHSE
ncbi:MAG: DUF6776 family protein [Pseudomonadales bacterium]